MVLHALLKKVAYSLTYYSFLVVDFLIPKNESVWIVASHSGIGGNARFFAEQLLAKNNKLRVHFYSLGKRKSSETEEYLLQTYQERFCIVKRRNLKSLFIALQAKNIFVTHDLIRDVGFPLSKLGKRRLIVNLWHGIATKKHWLVKKERFSNHKSKAAQFSKIVASSEIDAIAKAATFQKPLEDIWVTGTPRNDILTASDPLPADLAQLEQKLLNQLNGKRLILYAPTWRSFQNDFAPLEKAYLGELTEVLEQHNAVLGMRLHEKDEHMFQNLYDLNPLILNLGQHKYPEVQVLLKNARILITDYSSIWLDYLLTGNPVIAYWYDFDRYHEKRGTLWDMEQLFPGEKVYNGTELIAAIKKALTLPLKETEKQQYDFARSLFHKYSDGNNTQRVAKKVEAVISKKDGRNNG
ncbi:CDP-glycerol--poly(glycerophosphate) glycerophosphotransferase [Dethiobacter alkaliphilus]|uniref:CDP-glycerol:poly(Glycerophosphate) glycerophosphotransferase n=1 Tax=Dethiobacter alkaliphilus AHT 1 TaxID=555088 RepID=C0GGT0_DETAL|nr:CDP-glycerol--poly(glycerophosphate) glycerophosphotransferase [Dethiobacter alkaliphilus]EEG77521.1 CDP-glycerol:poly(glycerophosphate) glycerophosphotransferase [Dethiobacter alkaliphilus AHT 1]